MQRLKKIESISAIADYDGHLKGFLATLKSQTTFSTLTINYCHGLRKGLETLTFSVPINHYCCGLTEELKIQIFSVPINNDHHSLRKGLET